MNSSCVCGTNERRRYFTTRLRRRQGTAAANKNRPPFTIRRCSVSFDIQIDNNSPSRTRTGIHGVFLESADRVDPRELHQMTRRDRDPTHRGPSSAHTCFSPSYTYKQNRLSGSLFRRRRGYLYLAFNFCFPFYLFVSGRWVVVLFSVLYNLTVFFDCSCLCMLNRFVV